MENYNYPLKGFHLNSLASFENKIKGWIPLDKARAVTSDFNEMKEKLESLIEIGQYLIVEMKDEKKNSNFDRLSAIECKGSSLKLIWYKYRDEKNKIRNYAQFIPEKMLIYCDCGRLHNNFIAFKTKHLETIREIDRNPQVISKFDNMVVLLHPKGSLYSCNPRSREDLLGRLKQYM